MLPTNQDKLREEVDELVSKHGSDRSALMPILQAVQRKYSCVSDFVMQIVADRLGIHPVEVYGVVSFYEFLTTKPQGRFVIRLCRTISCDMQGKDRLARQLRNDLGIDFGETTPDGMFTLKWVNCIGLCDEGPAMLINDKAYTRVTPERVQEVLAEYRSSLAPFTLRKPEEQIA